MFSTLDDRQVDDLLTGKPTANADLAPLVGLVGVLRRSVAEEPAPTMGAALRAQLRATPVVPLTMGQAGRSALFKAGAVAAAVAAVVGLGVGATQNRLPSGLQDVLSSTADIVGIDVPQASERRDGSDDARSQRDDRGSSNGNDDGVPGGGNDNANGGATPADPGTPGDQAPATPATPPEHSGATPGANQPATADERSEERGDDSPGGPTPPAPVATPTVPVPTPEPPAPQPEAPVSEPAEPEIELGNGNASAKGAERSSMQASANPEPGDGGAGRPADTGGGDGGGRPDATLEAAGHGRPADVALDD